MVGVTLANDKVIFAVRGFHKFLAFKTKLEIPRLHIMSVRHDPDAATLYKGMRVLGTHIPGLVAAGSFRHDGKRVFWDVGRSNNIVVVDLAQEKYDQLIIEVEDPQTVVAQLSYN
ncbi:hypothetical protein ACFL6I_15080 [candidate division KSB1 bacterium]